jgi:DNA-3-methyladenine glycosylase
MQRQTFLLMMQLPQEFYARPARRVAVDLLGKRLVRLVDGRRVGGIIVETEAYCDGDELDLACHGDRANNGRPTPRTQVMFGPAGFAYVYFTYGMHWMFNIVTGAADEANAVLVRALEPVEGEEIMVLNRGGKRPRMELTNGPAKLAQALVIDRKLNGANLFRPDGVIWLEDGPSFAPELLGVGPRVGLGKTPEPWYSMPWRYWVKGNVFVSRS